MRREEELLIILKSEICIPNVNSIHSHHDLSNSPSPVIPGPNLPPGHLDHVLSHPPDQLFRSRGCQATELMLKCPVHKMLIVQSARFTPATGNLNPDITNKNCSSQTKHSEAAEEKMVTHKRRGDKDIRNHLYIQAQEQDQVGSQGFSNAIDF